MLMYPQYCTQWGSVTEQPLVVRQFLKNINFLILITIIKKPAKNKYLKEQFFFVHCSRLQLIKSGTTFYCAN